MSFVLINLIPPRAGGGLQNALSFLTQLAEKTDLRKVCIIACVSNSPIHTMCMELNFPHETFSTGILGRLYFELFGGINMAWRNRARVVFSIFGNAPLVSPGLYKISGFALSNILHPEEKFWSFLPYNKRKFKEFKDVLRLWAARQSHEIIVETEYLANRARKDMFSDKIVHVVKMEPSKLVLKSLQENDLIKNDDNIVDLLYLSGPHPNKRIHLLAEILFELNKLATHNKTCSFRLVVTLPKQHLYTRQIIAAFEKSNASDFLINLGSVQQEDVGKILRRVDGVINISKLESFSNNWVEAWAAELPLISVDADWARASCNDAAIYVDPLRVKETASRMYDLYCDRKTYNKVIQAGADQLLSLKEKGMKINQYEFIIKAAIDNISTNKLYN